MDNITTILILIAISVVIGFVAGLLIAGWRSSRSETTSAPKRTSASAKPSTKTGGEKTFVESTGTTGTDASLDRLSTEVSSDLNPEETAKPPSMNPVDILARAITADVKSPEQSSKSIVVQVDEILQESLAGTSLENRGISLKETPAGGMVVNVGLEKYDGVDAVPEADIRQAIRAAVSKWENLVEEKE